ncbi:MAG: DUF2098 domain-containing protein [Methanomicrobiales archaeon]|nr:DUF2098 domain-containing protein [Methanomicrobiales archaeon]
MDGSEIQPGSTVRYPRTGTTGTVADIEEINGRFFARLESTGLLYRIDQLVAIGSEKQKRPKEQPVPGRGGRPKLDEALSAEEIQKGVEEVDGVGAG